MLLRAWYTHYDALERDVVARNQLLTTPPYAVEQGLKTLGQNLRTARIRRDLTIADAAERIGTGPRAIMDAEKGKSSTGIVVYIALLWLYDLLSPFEDLADPSKDEQGLTLAGRKGRTRARKGGGLDNDF